MSTLTSTNMQSITDRPTSSAAALLALALLLPGAVSCNRNGELPEPEREGQPVRTSLVELDSGTTRVRLPGVTRAVDRADLAFLHGGQLAERKVVRGQQVAIGDALAVLHNPTLMPGVNTAEARLNEIERQLEQLGRETRRLEDLHERGLVATEELDRTRSRRDALRESRQAAEAVLAEAREQLAEGTLRAPFSGRIVELTAEPGQYLAPGQVVLSLAASDRLEVAIDVPGTHAAVLAPGQAVAVRRLDTGRTLYAEITEIGLARPGRTAPAVIALPAEAEERWPPGQSVQVELHIDGEPAMVVPLAAINDPGRGSPRIFVVRDGLARAVPVEVGGLAGGRVRIVGDVQDGEEVIVSGHARLLDGERVRVLR